MSISHIAKLIVLLSLSLTAGSARADFVEDFNDLSDMDLNGSAQHISGDVLRLAGATFQAGSAFRLTSESLVDLVSFTNYFQFRMANSSGGPDTDGVGADGLVFVIGTSSSALGALGSGIGYQGITKSVGVEFDTWNNFAQADPNGNHVGINLNGSVTSVVTATEATRFNTSTSDANNNLVWHAWVDYNAVSDLLEVRWAQNASKPGAAQLSHVVDLNAILMQNTAFFGFTGGTGGARADHDLLHWAYEADYVEVQAVPEPTTLALLGVTAIGGLGASHIRRRREKSAA